MMIRRIPVVVALIAVVLLSARAARTGEATSTAHRRALVAISVDSEGEREHFATSGLPFFVAVVGERHSYFVSEADLPGFEVLAGLNLSYQILDSDLKDGGQFYIAYLMPGRPPPAWERFGTLLLEDGFVLLRASPAEIAGLAQAGVEVRALSLTPKPVPTGAAGAEMPAAVDPDPVIQAMIDQVDSASVYTYTGGLSGEWPVTIGGSPYTLATRYTYSGLPIQKAVEYTGDHLEGLGLPVEYHQWAGATYPNVIGELQGLTNPEDVFIIGAHLDDMPPGSLAPGADDNASGSTAVLIAADILTQYRWGCTLRFALWTGEEQGLLGSEAYAERAYNDGENILGVLNLDMIGWNTPASSRDIDLHANSSLPQTLAFAQLFADVVSAYNLDLVPQIVPNGSGASDHASFWQYGYNAILGIEDFGDFNPYYHTTQDQLENLDISYYTEFVKASVGTFAHLTDCLIPDQSPVPDWDTAVWIGDSGPYAPDGGPFDVLSDEEVTIVDQVSITATGTVTFTLGSTWTQALNLVGWQTGSGTVISDTNGLTWTVEGSTPGVSHAITKTYQVSGENWITGSLTGTLSVEGADPQPDPVEIEFHHLLPEIAVDPVMVEALASPGEVVTKTLAIDNPGGVPLDWILAEDPEAAWLEISPPMGTTAPGGQDVVILAFDSGGLAPGRYEIVLAIESNDPFHSTVEIPAALVVDSWRIHLAVVLR